VLATERVVRWRPGDKDGHGESYEPALATGNAANAAAVATQTAKKVFIKSYNVRPHLLIMSCGL
jgi:hypothetical protein